MFLLFYNMMTHCYHFGVTQFCCLIVIFFFSCFFIHRIHFVTYAREDAGRGFVFFFLNGQYIFCGIFKIVCTDRISFQYQHYSYLFCIKPHMLLLSELLLSYENTKNFRDQWNLNKCARSWRLIGNLKTVSGKNENWFRKWRADVSGCCAGLCALMLTIKWRHTRDWKWTVYMK